MEPLLTTALIGLGAFLVVGVLIGIRLIDRRPAPTSIAVEYLDAISRGDAAAANVLCPPELIRHPDLGSTVDRTTFMSSEALGNATGWISDIRIARTGGTKRRNLASVYFSYSLAGQRIQDQAVQLRWTNRAWSIERGVWELFAVEPVFDQRLVSTTSLRVILGGAESTSEMPPVRRVSYLAYPAVYPIVIGVDGWHLTRPDEMRESIALTPLVAGRLIVPHFVGHG